MLASECKVCEVSREIDFDSILLFSEATWERHVDYPTLLCVVKLVSQFSFDRIEEPYYCCQWLSGYDSHRDYQDRV